MKHIEDTHQAMLFDWSKFVSIKVDGESKKLYDYLYAIPNGGKRDAREAARLKRQGVKAGVSDVHLPIPRGYYHSLYIEMKKPIVKGESRPVLSKSQKEWINKMNAVGNLALVCFGFEEAKSAITDYLNYGGFTL